MQKVTSVEKDALVKSLAIEWTAVLGHGSSDVVKDQVSPAESKYWDEPVRKMQRIAGEAITPVKKG